MSEFRPAAFRRRLISATIACVVSSPVLGDVITWTGQGDNRSWDDANNWDLFRPPQDGDEVHVTDTGQDKVVYSGVSGTSNVLSVSSPVSLDIIGGTLNVDISTTINGDLTQTGGIFGGPGVVNVSGTFNWNGGRQAGPGETQATEVIINAERSFVTLDERIVLPTQRGEWNSGNINGSNGGGIHVPGNATFIMQPTIGGNFTTGGNSPSVIIIDVGGEAEVPAGRSVNVAARMTSNGRTTVAGTLSVSGGGAGGGQTTVQDGGLWNNSNGTFTGGEGSMWDGAGTVGVSGGELNIEGLYDPNATRLTGGTLKMATDASTEDLLQAGGTLDTGFEFLFDSATFSGGTWTGGGRMVGNYVTIDAGNSFVRIDDVDVVVNERGESRDGDVVGSNDAGVTVSEGAEWFFLSPDGDLWRWNTGGQPRFRNDGSANVQTPNGMGMSFLYENNGRTTVDGPIDLNGGGSNNGDFVVSGLEAAVKILDDFVSDPGSTFTGDGTAEIGGGTTNLSGDYDVRNTIIRGGMVLINTPIETDNLTFSSGVIDGVAPITTRTFDFTSGTLKGEILSTERTQISGAGFKHIDGGDLAGEGQGTWERGNVTMSNSSQWNFRYDMFLIDDVSAGIRDGGGESSLVRNFEHFAVDTGGTVTFDVDFEQVADATLELYDGSGLRVDGQLKNVDPDTGTISGGHWNLGGPVTVHNFPLDINVVNAGIGLAGENAGFFDAQGNDLMGELEAVLESAMLSVSERDLNVSEPLDIEGGFNIELGDVNVDGDVNFGDFSIVSANFANFDAVIYSEGDFNGNNVVAFKDFLLLSGNFSAGPEGGARPGGGAAGKMTVGEDFIQSGPATMVVDIEGVDPETGHDWLDVGGTATLGGTLEVRVPGPYMPELDDEFVFVTAGSVTGAFDVVDAPCLPGGQFDVIYGDNSVILRLVSAARGDGNCDGRVDLDDYDVLAGCLSGPGGGLLPECTAFDLDFDEDVDMADFRQFQLNFTGP